MTAPSEGCGTCSLCCKVMRVEDPELSKPAGQWCHNCIKKDEGCTIYDTRPKQCRDFECMWLQWKNRPGGGLPLRFRPDNCGVVFGATRDGKYLMGFVNPGTPFAWKEGPAAQMINFFKSKNQKVFIVVGSKIIGINCSQDEYNQIEKGVGNGSYVQEEIPQGEPQGEPQGKGENGQTGS